MPLVSDKVKNVAKSVYEALQKEFGDKFNITFSSASREGRGIIIIAKLIGKDSIIIRIMENSKARLEPYFRISLMELKKFFDASGEAVNSLDLTHLDLSRFSTKDIIDLGRKVFEYALNYYKLK